MIRAISDSVGGSDRTQARTMPGVLLFFVLSLAAYVGAAVTKSVILALVTLATATLFVPVHVDHPAAMILFLVGIATGFCLFGFAIGVWAQNFEQLQIIPMLVITPVSVMLVTEDGRIQRLKIGMTDGGCCVAYTDRR